MEGFNVLVAMMGNRRWPFWDDSVDLLLLDVMMPKKNGIDTLKELRQTHQTPVIMLTARGSELDRVLGLELGADDYLPKPFQRSRAGGPYTRDSAPFPLERAAADDRSRLTNPGSGMP
ncbi:Copper-sensing two-component system response regulator CpxR [Klebsiella pneumoniae]|uniref:Copper-sensing two-component system response regulator CpxR n=1 Tax=Klebsiella pneumoniae TaxID=573 RepID=A0A2X3CZA2_KLEPN|nr:Copper-sensing two-component system response regulator CpxR [Klebsiella pneumoniae]